MLTLVLVLLLIMWGSAGMFIYGIGYALDHKWTWRGFCIYAIFWPPFVIFDVLSAYCSHRQDDEKEEHQ